MTPHQKAAHDIINEYYYTLPNNGSLNTGINSCESRYKEAIDCALICVKHLILTLQVMDLHAMSPQEFTAIRINFFTEVESELNKVKREGSRGSFQELVELFK